MSVMNQNVYGLDFISIYKLTVVSNKTFVEQLIMRMVNCKWESINSNDLLINEKMKYS